MADETQFSDPGEPDTTQVDPFTNEAEQPVWENIGGDH